MGKPADFPPGLKFYALLLNWQ